MKQEKKPQIKVDWFKLIMLVVGLIIGGILAFIIF